MTEAVRELMQHGQLLLSHWEALPQLFRHVDASLWSSMAGALLELRRLSGRRAASAAPRVSGLLGAGESAF